MGIFKLDIDFLTRLPAGRGREKLQRGTRHWLFPHGFK